MIGDILVLSLIGCFIVMLLCILVYTHITSMNIRNAVMLLIRNGACISLKDTHIFKGKYGRKYIIYRFDTKGDAIPEYDEYYVSRKIAVNRFLEIIEEQKNGNTTSCYQVNYWH